MSDPVVEAQKREAGEAAAALVESGMRIGLGTGSTVRYTIEAIGRKLTRGELHDVIGVPTSEASDRLARSLGIPLASLAELPRLDLCIDGADEVSPELDLIKGLGAALLREKIVAAASARLAIVIDAGKRVSRLGTRAPLPVAVLPFGWQSQLPFLAELGAVPELRRDASGEIVVTDDGLFLLDCRFAEGIDDPAALERALAMRPGIVECGLFLNMCERVFVAGDAGVTELRRRSSTAAPEA
ncbi:MAG: ribose 5-phosphate isomerase A [Caldilineae bacterium]|nr:ribose 5-phosphate isomerase A [Chloroflexota bacterium]MCB9175767.1 ribose 5-phosphate isomerase A [Caldilineae bacterium]